MKYSIHFPELSNEVSFEDNPKDHFQINVTNLYNNSYQIYLHGPYLPRSIGYSEDVVCEILNGSRECKNFLNFALHYQFSFLESPFDTHCLDYTKSKFQFNQSVEYIDSQLACLQECLKQKHRSSLFLFSKKDRLKYSLNAFNDLDKLDKRLIKHCESRCLKQSCTAYYHNFFRIQYNNETFHELQISKKYYSSKSVSVSSNFEFFLQFFGFIGLTFGLNFTNLYFKIINCLKSSSSKFNKIYTDFKLLFDLLKKLILISLYIVGFLISNYQIDQYFYHNRENRTVITMSIPNDLTVSLCTNLPINRTDLQSMNFDEIDRQSFKYNDLAKHNPFFKFEDDVKEVKSKLKTFFIGHKNGVYKCFTFDLHLEEYRYRQLLSKSLVIFEITNFQRVYITRYEKRFARDFKVLKPSSKLILIENKRLSDCKDYSIKKDDCDSRDNCIDLCYMNNYLTRISINKLPSNLVIYSNYFNESYKKQIHFDFRATSTQHEDKKILEECESKYLQDCTNSKVDYQKVPLYEIPMHIESLKGNLSLNLYFDRTTTSEEFIRNPLDFALDLLTLASILIGINLPLFISFLIKKLSEHFNKIKKVKNYLFLFYLIGFFIHFNIIIDETLHSLKVVNYAYRFNYLKSNEHIPNLIFCLNYNLTFRRNLKLTGHVLDQQLRHINYSYLFDEITYFDSNLNNKVWNSKKLNATNHTHYIQIDKNLKIIYFFFLDYKCFEIIYKIDFNNYKNSIINDIMKIKLNNKTQKKLVFNSKLDATDDFNDYIDLYTSLSYKITFEYFNIKQKNLYQNFANPMLFFKKGYPINDATGFIKNVKEDFKKNFNFTTKRISLNYEDWSFEIKDKLFDQYNLQYVRKQEQMGLVDYDYKRTSYRATLNYLDPRFHKIPTIFIYKMFHFNKIKYKDKNDFYSFLIKFLNSFAFWFNLSIFDLIDSISNANSWRWLLKLKNFIIKK